jgi:hypothetical protein
LTFEQFKRAMIRYSSVIGGKAPDFHDDFVCRFWFDALSHVEPSVLGRVIKAKVCGNFFPSINEILESCGAMEEKPEDKAREFVAMIPRLIEKHGYPNEARARQEVGEDCWVVIEAIGGWRALCNMNRYPTSTDLAQWRDVAIIALKRQMRINAGLQITAGEKKEVTVVKQLRSTGNP